MRFGDPDGRLKPGSAGMVAIAVNRLPVVPFLSWPVRMGTTSKYEIQRRRLGMKNGMTSCVFVTVLASLILSGCGRGSKTGTSPTPAPTQSNEWTWVAGASVPNQQGTYGTLGTDAPANVPGARSNAVSWTDATGNLWLFGGLGLYTGTDIPLYNDLWRYSAGE